MNTLLKLLGLPFRSAFKLLGYMPISEFHLIVADPVQLRRHIPADQFYVWTRAECLRMINEARAEGRLAALQSSQPFASALAESRRLAWRDRADRKSVALGLNGRNKS